MMLNGPWKFHTGDDPGWANPDFDDSSWESVDLTAPPGAHDSDVGLTRYVPGWGARGHRGYSGYAWYRLRVSTTASGEEELALAGPPAVDSAYQVFVNGQPLGSAGRFSGRTPTVFSIQPRMFAIPRSLPGREADRPLLIAIRVWMGPWDLADPDGGGIHIAPALGYASSVGMLYQVQWLQTVRGYIVEVVEAAGFVLLALMALTLAAFRRSRSACLWLSAALVLTALVRANQAIFFWGQVETVPVAEFVSGVLLPPLCLAAWTFAWYSWLPARPTRWMPLAIDLFTTLYLVAQLFRGSWFHGLLPHWTTTGATFISTWVRVLFVVLTALIVVRIIRQKERDRWLLLAALALVSIGQFAREISALGVPGIWFPYGTGVSRTQFAYAAFDLVLFVLLLRQFLFLASALRSASPIDK
ncbi:MAG TPA: hypothetical protein VE825_09025 [Terriglobales bacterium]|nr:hypothetical protein [Terriglobales bacterium]